jgi:hypothetical protein
MSTQPEESQVPTSNVEVLLEVRELRGQVTTFIQLMTTQGEQLRSVDAKVATLDNRVTAIEASHAALSKAAPPKKSGWEIAGVVIPLVVVVIALLDRLYAGS